MLASRLKNRPQISTEGLSAYVDAVELAFGSEVDTDRLSRTTRAMAASIIRKDTTAHRK